MFVRDYAHEIGTVLWIFAIPFLYDFFGYVDKFVLHFGRAQNVIGSDASLTAVYAFAP